MGVNYYEIWRADSEEGPFSLIGTTSDSVFDDTSVEPSHHYCYYVIAVDDYSSFIFAKLLATTYSCYSCTVLGWFRVL
jgi:fibronectin type 3 domain-containing protein